MKTARAVVAGGCFWGIQYYFDQVPGVIETVAGYTGGTVADPTYDAVASGETGHAEAVLIQFDASKVSYETLLDHFFRIHDATQRNRQGPDVGEEYRSAIFYENAEQRASAIAARNKAQRLQDKQLVTEIVPIGPFYKAEDYHQKFAKHTGIGMCSALYEPLK